MTKIIDARGKACPLPVIETKKALATLQVGEAVTVWVDNVIAVQNLTKMAQQKQLEVTAETINPDHYAVTLSQTELNIVASPKEEPSICLPDTRVEQVVVVLASDEMGKGDEKLGRILMKGFIYALTEQEELPQTILLYNSGAYLSTETSDCITDLKFLEAQGVEVLTCGTCLNHYGLTEKLVVGSITNMYVILEKQMQATKIVRP